ncbi:hypothetical protein BDQ17DRAFT_794534 [Cyathus striatus]|nr:hypothetical protein BDQ17DRAFT_794534 [Cyathus striatus]
MQAQLGDITNLVQDQREALERKRQVMDERWAGKEERRADKEFKWIELSDMLRTVHDGMMADRQRAEEEKREAENKPGLEQIIMELRNQNAEQRELLQQLSESWRADCERHHKETLDAVRQTAQEQVPFNVQGYLDEFSKALASEVRMLLGEVGKLREERRALQLELGELLCMKSRHGPGGEFESNWRPPPGAPGGPPVNPPPPPPEPPMAPELPPQAKPGWRTIHKRRKKKDAQHPPAAAPPAPPHMQMQPGPSQPPDPRHQIRSWATWQPDPGQVPSSPSVNMEPNLMVPQQGSPGLFGPRSPRDSFHHG